jgi:ubiquinone/menaquinone biosynthesis C-methylase UbiE
VALAFLRALDDLARGSADELAALGGIQGAARLLDVGGGAGSHAAALQRAVPGLEATVLDLPEVEAVTRERHPDVRFLAGDLDQPRFGRPVGESWDVVLLANVLHDHPAERCAGYVAEASGLLASGGWLLVYEWLIEPDRLHPPEVAMFTLMMMIENEGGFTWTAEEVAAWMRRAGLDGIEVRGSVGPIAVVRGGPGGLA